jgi:hypothetical protein
VFLPGGLRGEVEVLDGDRQAVAFGPVQWADQRVPHLCVAVSSGAGQVVAEPERFTGGVAVVVESPGGQVVGVGVDADQPVRAGRLRAYPQPDHDDDLITFTPGGALLGRIHLSGHLNRMSEHRLGLVRAAVDT